MTLDKLKKYEEIINEAHGVKYSALENSLLNYYETHFNLSGGVALAFFSLPSYKEDEYYNNNHRMGEYPKSFINSIIGFHHFFELHLKESLSEYSDLLSQAVKGANTPLKILEKLDSGELTINQYKTVNFSFGLEILKQLKSNQKDSKAKYKLLKKHEFLVTEKSVNTLLKLHEYRNATLHRGNKILGYIPFDYFISQFVLPLVYEILKQSDYHLKAVNRKVACGVDILKTILKIKFDEANMDYIGDYDEEFSNKICHLAHLKELGRASFLRPVDLPLHILKREYTTGSDETDLILDGYNRVAHLGLKQYAIAEKLAVEESKNSRVNEILKCPCCGANTLLSYWEISVPVEGMPKAFKSVNEAGCGFCFYSISRSMGDPFEFQLAKKPVFGTDSDEGWPFHSFKPSRKELDDYE